MSEATKPVEEPVAAPTADIPAAEAVAETKAVEEPAIETPAVTEPAATEEAAPAVAEEVKPIEEGVLAYKAPGLIKSIFPSKKFFWFGSEPIEEKHLASYTRGEKDPNHNVAWAAHTGKGLLLFSKKATEKATPAGIINLADISDITTDGPKDFHFTLGGHKHSFEATSSAERDNWVAVLKEKSDEAKTLAPTVTEHETYKSKLEALKPVAAVAAPTAAAKKSVEVKKEEKAEAKEDKAVAKEEKKEVKEEKKDTKKRTNRSTSRKRNSIFGSFGLGKKEETAEAKPETAAIATESAPETAATEAAPIEADAEPIVPAAAESVPETAAIAPKAVEPKPTATKRNSIFGTIGAKFNPKKDTKSEAEASAPTVPAKDEPVSDTAPVIPAVESTEPLAASTLTPAKVPAETAPITNGETKAAETPVAAKDKRKSSLPWLSKKEKATSDSEGEKEKPKSPFSGLRNTFKKPKAKTPTAEAPFAAEPAATDAKAEEPAVSEPVVSEPVSAAPAATPAVSATA